MTERDAVAAYFLFTSMGYLQGVATMFWLGRVKPRDRQ